MNKELIELLCTVPEIEAYRIHRQIGLKVKTLTLEYNTTGWFVGHDTYNVARQGLIEIEDNNVEVIGNPLGERHLHIYCEKKGFSFGKINNTIEIICNKNGLYFEVKLDLSKDFHEQTDKVHTDILEFLKANKLLPGTS